MIEAEGQHDLMSHPLEPWQVVTPGVALGAGAGEENDPLREGAGDEEAELEGELEVGWQTPSTDEKHARQYVALQSGLEHVTWRCFKRRYENGSLGMGAEPSAPSTAHLHFLHSLSKVRLKNPFALAHLASGPGEIRRPFLPRPGIG